MTLKDLSFLTTGVPATCEGDGRRQIQEVVQRNNAKKLSAHAGKCSKPSPPSDPAQDALLEARRDS